MFVDPTEAEEYLAIISPETNTNHGVVTLSMLSELKQISYFTHIGSMDVECVTKSMDVLSKECEKIVPLLQKVLVANVQNCFEQRKRLLEEASEREQALNAMVEEWKKLLNAG